MHKHIKTEFVQNICYPLREKEYVEASVVGADWQFSRQEELSIKH